MAEATDTSLWSTVNPTSTSYAAEAARTANSSMDKDAFLKLLIAQMKYQDPLNPMDDKEFLSQMAQFTTLEQMQNMNATSLKSQAYSMIGKSVYAYYPNAAGEYEEVEGLVTAVRTIDGETYLTVDGKDVPASAVTEVGDDYFTSYQLNAIYDSVSNSRDLAMIGKYVQAIISRDGKSEFVEGVVDYVRFNGTDAILMVGDKEVYAGEVASVANDPLLIGKTINARYANDDGEYVSISNGTIQNVLIENDKAYLLIDGTKVPAEKINYVTEALQLVGKQISTGSITGTVASVTMKNGIPYLNIGDEELSYTEFRKIDTETEAETE